MAWDSTKSAGDLITSSDWNSMVTDQKGHASRHSDGGSDELDAADLAGGLGTSGQVLQSDGSAASWVDFSGGHSVSDSGTQVLAEPGDVNFNSNLTVTDDGDGSVTVDASGGGGGNDQQVEDTNKVIQQVIRFGNESAETTSSSYVTIADSDIALDFAELKDGGGDVFVKFKYHLANLSSFGEETGDTYTFQADPVSSTDSILKFSYSEEQDAVYVLADEDPDTGGSGIKLYGFERSGERFLDVDVSSDYSSDVGGIAVLPDDAIGDTSPFGAARIVTVDNGNSNLNYYDLQGNFISSVDISSNQTTSSSMTYNPSTGELILVDTANPAGSSRTILEYSATGTFAESYSLDFGEDVADSVASSYNYDNGHLTVFGYQSGVGSSSTNNTAIKGYEFQSLTDATTPSRTFDISGQTGIPSGGALTFMSGFYDPVRSTYVTAPCAYDSGSSISTDVTAGELTMYEYMADDGSSSARVYRQNAGTSVTGSEVTGATSRQFEILDSGWIDFGAESGAESYQLQLKTSNGSSLATYNSVVMFVATTQ